MSLNEEVHAKLLHDYHVVGWKYSACSFKNKIFIGIFGLTLHVFVVVVVVVVFFTLSSPSLLLIFGK